MDRWMRQIMLIALCAAVLAGCDSRRIDELEEGVATEAEVRAKFGVPAAIYLENDGSRTLEYPRQPAGQTNYMITIDANGTMSALRQVVKPATFAQVTAGLDKARVRRLLGQPAKTRAYALKQQEVWDWRFADGNENKLFSVTFDRDGQVVATGTTIDGQEIGR